MVPASWEGALLGKLRDTPRSSLMRFLRVTASRWRGRNTHVSTFCYLVAIEHLRGLGPEETACQKPLIQQNLADLRQAARASDYIDLTRQQATAADLGAAAGQDPNDAHDSVDNLGPHPANEVARKRRTPPPPPVFRR